MRKRLPKELESVIERLHDQIPLTAKSEELFQTVLELVDYVARREDLIRARGRDLEPDHLARSIFRDPQKFGVRAVNSLLAGLGRRELKKIEEILLSLERIQGAVRKTPPYHRILLDGAILGQVGLIYSRKFEEVVATRLVPRRGPASSLLPDLLRRVDCLFEKGLPAYLWRLGPEFGTDFNVSRLLERGDWFIVRSLYRSRAERLAEGVLRWRELHNGHWIGENCDEHRYASPARQLVLRVRDGNGFRHALLVTNLYNTSWEEIYRFYRNRSCQQIVDWRESGGRSEFGRKLAASFMILAIFTFRNVRTWADTPTVDTREQAVISQQVDPSPTIVLVDSTNRPELFQRLGEVIEYLAELTEDQRRLSGVAGSPAPVMSYQVAVAPGKAIRALADGQVLFVDRPAGGRASIVINHGSGFSTVYGNLASLEPEIRVGSSISKGQILGAAVGGDSGRLHFEARITQRYLEASIEPSVAEVLSPSANLFLDPLGLLSSYESTPSQADEEVLLEPHAPAAPSLEDADVYWLESPSLPGGLIFIANAALEDEGRVDPIADVFDDDIFLTPPLGDS